MKHLKLFEEFDSDDKEDREMMELAEKIGANPTLKKNWSENLGVPVTTTRAQDIALDVIHSIVKLEGYHISKT